MAALSPDGGGVDGEAAGGFAPLQTARLTLRPLRAGDAPALHRLVNDWEVARRLVVAKYQPTYGGDLSGWRRSALPVAVDLAPPAG